MQLGYNTNGLAHHDPIAAIDLLAEIGYRSIALTVDHGLLNPYSTNVDAQLERIRDRLSDHALGSVIETGARFLLDARVKHEPTLLTADESARARRVDFLCRCIDMAANLECDCVSLWSGILRDPVDESVALARLAEGLGAVVQHAERRNVVLGFEPEPGMLIDTLDRFEQLSDRIGSENFRLTLDVGHLHCQGELPIADKILRWGDKIVNVHIEDMRAGVHEHLEFGDGEMEFPSILEAFGRVGYRGGLHVELSRHSHDGPEAARRAFAFLGPLIPDV